MRREWVAVMLLCATAAHAGSRTTYASPAEANLLNRQLGSSPGIMLYFSHAIGGGGGGGGFSKPAVGLRLNRMHLVSGYFKPDAPDPMQSRELVNWHFGRGANNRVELGRRVSWSPSEGSFGRHSGDQGAFVLPSRAALALHEPVVTQPQTVRSFDTTRTLSDPIVVTRQGHSSDLLEARMDPSELRLDRRVHDTRNIHLARH